MTLALGVASRAMDDAPERSQVYVMADSRLSFDEWSLDRCFKAVTLGVRSAAVAAGGFVPFVLAVEGARPFIIANAEDRAKRGLSPLSVWSEASFVWLHLELIFDQYRQFVSSGRSVIIVAGFFSDNTPGLIRLEREGTHRQILVFRPAPGQRAHVVVGTETYAPIVKEAIRRSAPPDGNGFHDVASVMWDIIKHQGEPARSVGGGLSFGFAKGDSSYFYWPILELEGQRFIRGLQYPPNPRWPNSIPIQYDPALFATLERSHASQALQSGDSPDTAVMVFDNLVVGDPRLFIVEADDSWLLDELRQREQAVAAARTG